MLWRIKEIKTSLFNTLRQQSKAIGSFELHTWTVCTAFSSAESDEIAGVTQVLSEAAQGEWTVVTVTVLGGSRSHPEAMTAVPSLVASTDANISASFSRFLSQEMCFASPLRTVNRVYSSDSELHRPLLSSKSHFISLSPWGLTSQLRRRLGATSLESIFGLFLLLVKVSPWPTKLKYPQDGITTLIFLLSYANAYHHQEAVLTQWGLHCVFTQPLKNSFLFPTQSMASDDGLYHALNITELKIHIF